MKLCAAQLARLKAKLYVPRTMGADRAILSAAEEKEAVTRLREEVSKGGRVDLEAVREACAALGSVPGDLRREVWAHLLGMHGRESSSLSSFRGERDLTNQGELRRDCEATAVQVLEARGITSGGPTYDTERAALVDEMELLLTVYCYRSEDVEKPVRACLVSVVSVSTARRAHTNVDME